MKQGFTIIELNKGDEIVFNTGVRDFIHRRSYVIAVDDFDAWHGAMEKEIKEEIREMHRLQSK